MANIKRSYTCTYSLGVINFSGGAGAGTAIKGPKGKRGWLVDVGVRVIETFACDTTTAKVRLGTSSDADHYAELAIADATAATDVFNTVDDRDAVIAEKLPSDTQIEVSYVSSADTGVAAGSGEVFVVINWY